MTNNLLRNLLNSLKTLNPFEICEQKNITVLRDPLGSIKEYYCNLMNHQFVFINPDLDEYESKLVCTHEVGHALLRPEINLFYTVFPIGRYETEANNFAVNAMLMDAKSEYPDYGLYELARDAGIPRRLLEAAFDHIVINQNHQLNWWYAQALKGHITGAAS